MCNLNLSICSFASPDLILNKIKFIYSTSKQNIFRDIKVYGLSDLSQKIKKNIRKNLSQEDLFGYGFWQWKPFILLDMMNSLPKNSTILYCDVGSSFFFNKKTDLSQYNKFISICEKEEMCVFDYSQPLNNKNNLMFETAYEYQFTKKAVFDFFKINKYDEIYNSPQISAGCFFIKNTEKIKKIINDWLNIMVNNPDLINNKIDDKLEDNRFVSCRNDQSLFSIIVKKINISRISVYDYFEPGTLQNKVSWSNIENSPIKHTRKLYFLSIKRLARRLKF